MKAPPLTHSIQQVRKMGKNIMMYLSVVLMMLCLLYEAGTVNSSAATATAIKTTRTSFIRTSCEATIYKSVCVQSLVGYASAIQGSHRQLAQTALAVSLKRAQATRAFMSKMSKLRGLGPEVHEAIRDCVEEIGDSVDRISQSVQELKTIWKEMSQSESQSQSKEFFWHLSNVQTWVSSALTDDGTCMDGLSDSELNPNIKASIRDRVTNVAHLTSNALALINNFSAHF